MKNKINSILLCVFWVVFLNYGCLPFANAQFLFKDASGTISNMYEFGTNASSRIGLGFYPAPSNLRAKFHIYADITSYPAFKIEAYNVENSVSLPVGLLESFVTHGSQKYGIYQTSEQRITLKNYFQDPVGVGIEIPRYKLDVNGEIGCNSILNFLGSGTGITITSSSLLNPPFTFTYNYLSNPNPPPYFPLSLHYWGAEIGGRLECDTFLLRRDPGLGKILVSDEYGSGSWMDASLLHDDDWLVTLTKEGGLPEPHSIYLNTDKYQSVLIGTDIPQRGYLLAVTGKILCEELKVKLVTDWPDYVFEKNHDIPSLKDVEKFIIENKNLPDVPTAKEVNEKGINIGEMNAILLKKVEELTVYIIAMQKEMEQLKAKISGR